MGIESKEVIGGSSELILNSQILGNCNEKFYLKATQRGATHCISMAG